MKVRCLFALLALSVSWTNPSFAGRHGPHTNADTKAHASGTAAEGQGRPASPGPQGSAPSGAASDQVKEGTAKDRAGPTATDVNGKRTTDTPVPHAKAPPKAGASTDTAPVGGNGQPHPLTRGNSARESEAGAAIDTLITVHQGRPAPNSNQVKEIRDLQERLFKKPKTAGAPAIDPVHHQHPPLGADGAPVRNAVGAITERPAAVPPSGPPAPSDSTRQGSGLPAIGAQVPAERGPGAVTRGDTPKQLGATVSPSSANATQPAKTTALATVTTSGPAINGSSMIRPGSTSAVVGGSAKVVAGAISGGSFRPRHP